MSLVLDVGKYQIPSDRVMQQLRDIKILPQLMAEMTIDELVDRHAKIMSIDLTYTQFEFDKLATKIIQTSGLKGLDSDQLAGIVDRQLKLNKFKTAKWGDEIETYFHSQSTGLDRVIVSVLQVPDALLAQELKFRIQAGEQSFTEIVLDYSEGDGAENGGVIGPILVRDLPLGISEIITQLQSGEISDLFQLDLLYTYFRLDELSPATLDDRMENFLLDELFNNWVEINK
jgi:parvulin-like peptidyl-prolyl isomerase